MDANRACLKYAEPPTGCLGAGRGCSITSRLVKQVLITTMIWREILLAPWREGFFSWSLCVYFSLNLENWVKTKLELHSWGDNFRWCFFLVRSWHSLRAKLFLYRKHFCWSWLVWDFSLVFAVRLIIPELRARWASGHTKCCNARVVPVSQYMLLFSNTLECHMFWVFSPQYFGVRCKPRNWFLCSFTNFLGSFKNSSTHFVLLYFCNESGW